MKRLILTMALFAGSAHAEFISGNRLLSDLDSESSYGRGFATGYIIGVVDRGYNVNHCIPADATVKQVVDVVKRALVQMPQVRHYTGDAIVYGVLQNTWPCAKKGGDV